MRTIFVSANDTGVGKTRATAALAHYLLARGARVQIVKVVETGVASAGHTLAVPAAVGSSAESCGDAALAMMLALEAPFSSTASHAGDSCSEGTAARISAHTLVSFAEPLSPLDAAELEGRTLDFDALVAAVLALPAADWRIVEGAGGLAVPLERGANARDWADFSLAISAEANVLVVGNRLGAINQARLLAAYAKQRGLANAGLWLNQAQADLPAAVAASNAAAFVNAGCGLPLRAQQGFDQIFAERMDASWLM